MKRLLCLMLTALLLLPLLAGCSEPEDSLADKFEYRLIKEDGKYYILMNLEPFHSDNLSAARPAPIIEYDSLEEMIDDLKNGNFTENEFYFLAEHERTQDGKIKAPNLDALVEPIVPDLLGDYVVQHEGDLYRFNYRKLEGASSVHVSIVEKQYHDDRVEGFIHYEEKLAGRDQLTVTQDSERNATVYTWVANENTCKYILYTVSDNETVYYVEERYYDAESGMISILYIWFEYQGEYVYVNVKAPEERPTVEWITSFAVKPYEG